MASSIWHKVAGVMGASGVALAAYGSHGFKPADPHFKETFTRANQQQMYHAFLLALAPFSRRPNITGGLALAGVLLFSGRLGAFERAAAAAAKAAHASCYASALMQDRKYGKLAPYGGFSFMAAWLSLLL